MTGYVLVVPLGARDHCHGQGLGLQGVEDEEERFVGIRLRVLGMVLLRKVLSLP